MAANNDTMITKESLQIEGNFLKDKRGRLIASIPTEIGLNRVRNYTHIFAVAADLRLYAKQGKFDC